MNMRCRPGDLARIVSSRFPENRNRLVRVIERHVLWDWRCEALQRITVADRFDASQRSEVLAGEELGCQDFHLQPLRDQPGTDETLTWKPVPQPIEAA